MTGREIVNPCEQIEKLLSESIAAAEERERMEFGRQLEGSDGTVVLFGAGRLGQLCIRALRRGGVLLRGVCDGNPALHGTAVEGAEILSPEDAAKRFGTSALFVVAIWTGTARESMGERIAYLQACGCRSVVSFPALLWAHAREETPFHSFDLPSRILAHRADLAHVVGLLADDISLETFERELLRRLRGEFASTPPAADQYFPRDLIEPAEGDVFVDGGAYAGDTLSDFLGFSGGRLAWYYGIDADSSNAARLRQTIASLPIGIRSKCTVHEIALHDNAELLSFAATASTTSQVVANGPQRVRGTRLDALVRAHRISFLKLDVEGAEIEALLGARVSLRRDKPTAAVCVYHRPEHLWRIPLALCELLDGHNFAMRCHGQDGWELVFYAVPKFRWRRLGAPLP